MFTMTLNLNYQLGGVVQGAVAISVAEEITIDVVGYEHSRVLPPMYASAQQAVFRSRLQLLDPRLQRTFLLKLAYEATFHQTEITTGRTKNSANTANSNPMKAPRDRRLAMPKLSTSAVCPKASPRKAAKT
jgi:hypothetical protein